MYEVWRVSHTLEKFTLQDGKEVWVVHAPYPMDRDKPEIVGTFVTNGDGSVWKVVGCERNMPAFPIYVGEKIGLKVEHATGVVADVSSSPATEASRAPM